MKENLRNCARAFGVLLAGIFVVAAGRVSAQGKQVPGQNHSPIDQKVGGSEVELRHQDRVCREMEPGGVCFSMDNGKLELLHVQGNAYMISGAGGNVTVQIGDSDVMVVDPGLAQMSDKVVAAIRALTDKPIFFIVDTSMDEDHTSGNANLSKAGWALPNGANIPFGHDVSNITGLRFPPGASIISHINALDRMSAPNGQKSLAPQASWPTDVYDADDWRLYNGEEVYIYHLPAAHTDGDSVVLFRRSAVVSTGDLFTPLTSYPVIEEEKGGSIDGFIDGLNQIIEMLVPEDNEEGGTYVIPGHGRVCDRNDVVNFRDMVTIIRGRIDAMIKEGMTLEQVKAAKPTVDYDGLGGYRATKDQFIGAVYRDLSRNQQGKKAAVAGGER